jgi:hypothetical protein
MRQTHWWGAAAGVVAIASAAFVAPAAVAATTASPPKPGKAASAPHSAPHTVRYGKVTGKIQPGKNGGKNGGTNHGAHGGTRDDDRGRHDDRRDTRAGQQNGGHGGNGRGDHGKGHHGKPPYPPGRTCAMSIEAPSRAKSGRVATVSTTVSVNNRALRGVKVALYASRDGQSWKLVSTTTTDAKGLATFSYTVRHDTLVRTVVARNDNSEATQSATATIRVKR